MVIVINWLIVLIQIASSMGSNDRTVHVTTTNGIIMGMKKPVLGKIVNIFLGIPFAKPPIGKLRFGNPESLENWTGILSATKLPKTCYQNLPEQHELNNPAWRIWTNNTEMSEDCLYLSIWTPSLPQQSSMPSGFFFNGNSNTRKYDDISTLVWIHGGGFTSGSSTLDVYNGEILASKMNVIVVNIQYRVGPFGFLSLNNKKIPGNQGLMDQVMALKWINNNIANFGGHHKYITIFGANAGAVSASFHLLSPLTQNLFNQAIMQSGSALAWWACESPETAVTKARHFANLTGCRVSNANKDSDIIECLQSLDPITIIVNQWKMLNERYLEKHNSPVYTAASFYFDIPFKPVYGSTYLPKKPIYYLRNASSNVRKKRVMLGATKNEGLIHLFKSFRRYFMPSDDGIVQPSQFRYGNSMTDPFDLLAFYLVDERFLHHFFIEAIAFEYELPTRLFQHFDWKPQDIINVYDNIAGDYSFKCPVVEFADLYLSISKVYLYSFEHQTKNLPLPTWTGVLQGQEIAYIFGKPFDTDFNNKYFNFTEEERELSNKMMTFWTNFAQTGYPNHRMKEYHTKVRETYWETYNNITVNNRKYIVIQNKSIYTDRNFRRHQCLFWQKYLPLMGSQLLSNTKCHPRKNPVPLTVPISQKTSSNTKVKIKNSELKKSKIDPNQLGQTNSSISDNSVTYLSIILLMILQMLSYLS